MNGPELIAALELLKKMGDKNRPRGSMAEDLILAWQAFTTMGGERAANIMVKLTEHQAVIEKFMIPPGNAAPQYLKQEDVHDGVQFVMEDGNEDWVIVLVMADTSVCFLSKRLMKESNLGVVFNFAWPGMRQKIYEELEDVQDPGPNDALYKEILEGEANSSA